jgi:CRP/FNR family cyclic AMP-dependent transcriptional regulator
MEFRMTPEDILRAIPLFQTLNDAERIELAQFMRPRNFQAGETVFWLGERGDNLYLVRSGALVVSCPDETGKEVRLAILAPGAFFGEISLLDGGPRTATVRADQASSLLSLGREDFLGFLTKHPDAAIQVLAVLGQRQRETLDKVRGIHNSNDAVDANTTRWGRVAERIATLTASRPFILFNLIMFATWVLANVILVHIQRAGLEPFDKPPTFSVLSLVVTIEALFISLFVLISQSLQGERDRIRADLDFQVNLKAHQEVMQLQQKVDSLVALLTPDKK